MIKTIEIENFKSIKKQRIDLGMVNVLIGANGAGKSNLISFFRMLREILAGNGRFSKYVAKYTANNILHYGYSNSQFLKGVIEYELYKYGFELNANVNGELFFETEFVGVKKEEDWKTFVRNYSDRQSKIFEYNVTTIADEKLREKIKEDITSFHLYHFNDTSSFSAIRQDANINDNEWLRFDGANLPAFLYLMKSKYRKHFERLTKIIQRVAPYFGRFNLKPKQENAQLIRLEWEEKGTESYFDGNNMSDGTLRFICLATVLCQPNPPSTIIIDEPELGLHPSAITTLIDLIRIAETQGTQILLATQSAKLLDFFEPKEIIVVNKSTENSTSEFEKLNAEKLNTWLEDYSMSEIWDKNLISGRP